MINLNVRNLVTLLGPMAIGIAALSTSQNDSSSNILLRSPTSTSLNLTLTLSGYIQVELDLELEDANIQVLTWLDYTSIHNFL